MATHIRIKKRKVRGQLRWVVDLRNKVGAGKRAFFKQKVDAERFADKLKLKTVEEEADPPIILIGKEKRDYLTAKDILAGKSFVEAAQFYVKEHKVFHLYKFDDAIAACLDAKELSGKADKYLMMLKGRLTAFRRYCQKEHCHDVTHEDIEKWLHNQGWQAVTKKGALIDLGTFFNFCLKRGWVVSNPCQNIEKVVVEQYARGILTPAQAGVFIRTVAGHEPGLVRYFVDQLFGGLREQEAQRLPKEYEHELHIELPGDDVYEPGFIEWNPTWKAWRDKYPGEYWPIRGFNYRVGNIKTKAKAEMVKAKVAKEDFWYPKNCLRHSFCSYGAKMWGTGKTAELARHSEAMQKKHYRRPIPLEDAKAFWAILP